MYQIITYLTFNGNCREAMEFYRGCIGGELDVQTISETPEGEKFPDDLKNLVVNASLKKGNILLMGTDLRDEDLVNGNTVSILVESEDEYIIKKYYKNLEKGGSPIHPLKKNHWGGLSGELTDKYGHHWLFHCKRREE
ncbi:VOC family protein [Flagellimonas olearia]|uniref:VOC family protein n=1 Tax=Flagellimonas olearia TaxID=552546 RepID=A0A6I1E9I1_9FLAO|nr:glyoxalase/bleomycin resistance/extradiol dioxygenase family protein [Allomuricauda olearia]KAB7530374.1 VOC family protein [Allomuricauda olearia]